MKSPQIPSGAENAFVALVEASSGESLCPHFLQLLSQAVCIGESGGGDFYLLSLFEKEPWIYRLSHESGEIEGPCASDLGSFLMGHTLLEFREDLSDKIMVKAIEKLRGRIALEGELLEVAENLEIDVDGFDFAPERTPSMGLLERGQWLLNLLSGEDFSLIRDRFDETSNTMDDESFAAKLTLAQRDVSSALYLLLYTFYFAEEQWFGATAKVAREHRSQVVRDAADYLERANRGENKKLGAANDIVWLRNRFLALKLPPCRVNLPPSRAEVALGAFAEEEQPRILEIVDRRTEDYDLKSDSEEALATARKLVTDERFVRVLVARVLDTDILPRFQGYDAMCMLRAIHARSGLDALIPLLGQAMEDHRIRVELAGLLGETKDTSAVEQLITLVVEFPKAIERLAGMFKLSCEAEVVVAAIESLGSLGDTRAIPAIESVFKYKETDNEDSDDEDSDDEDTDDEDTDDEDTDDEDTDDEDTDDEDSSDLKSLKNAACAALFRLNAPSAFPLAWAWTRAQGGIPGPETAWVLHEGSRGANASERLAATEAVDTYVNELVSDCARKCLDGEASEARELLSRGGKLAPRFIEKMVNVSEDEHPSQEDLKRLLPQIIQWMKEEPDFRYFSRMLEWFVVTLGYLDQHAEAVRLIEHGRESHLAMGPQLWTGYTYAAWSTQDEETRRRVAQNAEAMLEKSPDALDSAPEAFDNLASIWAQLGEKSLAIANVRRAKKAEYSEFEGLRTSEDLKVLWKDLEFQALFKKRRN